MNARAHGVLLLLMGTASGWFAWAGEYALLMNPMFRWITLAGAALVTLLGATLVLGGGRASRFAFVTFTLFFALVAWAGPHRGGVAPLLAPPDDGPAVERDGYEPIRAEVLFESIDTEARDVPAGKVRLRGFVKRTPELDARGAFILLEPMMACCLADAIALGLRVRSPDRQLPPDEAWVYAFGTLEALDPPRPVPPFRVGAILFTGVSRTHVLAADEVVGYEALLPSVWDQIPADRCSFFRQLLEITGLDALLRGSVRHTVFAPLDQAFDRWTDEQRQAVLADPDHAREVVSACIVPGRLTERELHARTEPLLPPLGGPDLTVVSQNGRLEVGNARLLFTDMLGRNGIVHIVHPVPYGDP